jgi:two-component system sensor histidine kinase MtrB
MAIALGYATLHDGVIDVWAEPGDGACFRLTLPRDGTLEPISPLGLPPVTGVDDA